MATLKEIGDHLDMSERNAGTICSNLGIKPSNTSLEDVRVAYIRDIRSKAAGRGGDAQEELTQSRIRETNANADLKHLMIAEKAGVLVPVADIEPRLVSMVTAARQELLTLPHKIATDIKALHNIEIDESLIVDRVHDSLKHLATRLQEDDEPDDDEGVTRMVATSEVDDD